MNRRVVVTGMGAITPIGKTVEETWKNLIEGKHGIAPITLFDTTNIRTKLAAEVKDFNPADYMERTEASRSDRFTQFGMISADQAMKDSGIAGTIDPERIGVYFGVGIGGMRTFEIEREKLLKAGPRRVSPLFVPMLIPNMCAGIIAIKHNCKGAAMPAITACASGSSAIGEAVRAIRHGYADAIISGGTEAAICETGVAGFINMRALSTSEDPDAASLPFDKRRGGFVIGEGSVALVLEEYERAKARGAKIYGEITGYGATSDAYHITSPRPDAEGGTNAMKQALAESNYKESDVVYINAHGTGTCLNDSIETLAIKQALGEEKAKKSFVSSTKSMTGHMLGAAGAIEALVSLKVLSEGIIPPTINLLEADENCDLNYVPNKALKTKVDLVLSNSLGFGGHNATLAFRAVNN